MLTALFGMYQRFSSSTVYTLYVYQFTPVNHYDTLCNGLFKYGILSRGFLLNRYWPHTMRKVFLLFLGELSYLLTQYLSASKCRRVHQRASFWPRKLYFARSKNNDDDGDTISNRIRPSSVFICPVLKTEWQIRHSIIGERQPNWSTRKLFMCRSVIGMVNQPFLKLGNEEGLHL